MGGEAAVWHRRAGEELERDPGPGRRDLHVGKSAVLENFGNILGEVDRRGVKHEIGDAALSVP